jgi:hypothetical protein
MNRLNSIFGRSGRTCDGLNLMIPIAIGLFFYAFYSRLNGLNPTRTEWLLPFWNGNIDSAANYLGWEYFRAAPILQWPLGRTPNLGPGSGASIAMTDSIPLMAFVFKPFTHWYQGTFQYFGIWTMLCFVIQAVASWKLLGLWIRSRPHLLFGCSFFVVAPAVVVKFPGLPGNLLTTAKSWASDVPAVLQNVGTFAIAVPVPPPVLLPANPVVVVSDVIK